MARVVYAQVSPEKGKPPIHKKVLCLTKGVGVEGDRHKNFAGRDVCILRSEILEWEKLEEIEGFCFHKHKPNLILEGLEQDSIRPGVKLCFPDGELEVSPIEKHCFPAMCPLAKTGKECLLKKEYQMCSISRSGRIQEGDEVVCG